MIVHWDNARHGDFRPWPGRQAHLDAIAGWLGGQVPHDVMVIAAAFAAELRPAARRPRSMRY